MTSATRCSDRKSGKTPFISGEEKAIKPNKMNLSITEYVLNLKILQSLGFDWHSIIPAKTESCLKRNLSPAFYGSVLAGFIY